MEHNELYDGPPIAPEDILSVYVILNGSLNMSPGKMAAQSFHCGWMANKWANYYDSAWSDWHSQGRRVTVRTAKTQHVFERAMNECEGIAQKDEGLTEVERGSITAFVTVPYTRAKAPKILSHSKVQLA